MKNQQAEPSLISLLFNDIVFLLKLVKSDGIMRRYFVVNGFDGALTMLGLIIGFIVSETQDLTLVTKVCLAAAVALTMSGLSSAYVSETAERQHALKKLESAMFCDLSGSVHARAAKFVPLLIALVNGIAPLLISLIILSPLWLLPSDLWRPSALLYSACLVAFGVIFLLGVFLGRVSSKWWLRSGVETSLLAATTAGLIYLTTHWW